MDSWSSAAADHLHELMSSDDHHNNRPMVPMSPVIKKEAIEYPEPTRPLCSPTMSTTMVPSAAHLHPSDDFHCGQMDYGSNGATCTFGGAPGGGASTSKVDPLIGFRPVEGGGLVMRMEVANPGASDCMGNRRKSGYDSSSSPDSPDRHFCSSTTASNGDLNLTRLEESGKEECDGPKRLCLVCGDSASGFHYGVASCEACKAFFKRTIQGNIEYTCPAANDCEINKRRRKACQACRFQKCLRMGMLKEGVRLDRVRGGRQKYRRNSELPYTVPNTPAKRPTLEENTIVMSLMQCEPELTPVQVEGAVDRGSTSDPIRSIGLLSDIFDKEIISTIGWAKQVPGFTELTLNDQMRLLQCTWTEILTLSVAFRSIHNAGKLVFATDFTLDEKLAKESGVFDLYQPCMQVVDRLEKAGVCKEEYCLLKALVLSNADTRIEDHSAVKKFRDSITSSLYDCTSVMRQGNTTAHMNSVLLCLPSLRQSDQIIKRFWLAVRREGKVVMNKLFVEMLEAHFR